ncbi:CBS domain-containing protein [Neisseriaceae bacterium PsAf]|nr:CBS domain-containing protein [Neisseriaceae bacterium PsAf]MCV2503755.1 CBS domain-containing protein [Neisseriaceae bacterium]
MEEQSTKQSFWDRVSNKRKKNNLESKEDLVWLISQAKENEIIDQDTFNLMINALAFSTLEVRDAMISHSQMQVVHIDDSLEKIVDFSIKTSHSRFPVVANEKDEVVGILHVKDLLNFFFNQETFNLNNILREVVYVPEGKSLPTLIKEFREKRNHIAIVVDEYGGVSGLVTLEDVIEEIFGDIEDEFDVEDTTENIVQISQNTYQVNATTEIEEFNEYFSVDFTDEDVDTVGGLVLSLFGYMPSKGESIEYKDFKFQVVRVDRRRILILKVTRLEVERE